MEFNETWQESRSKRPQPSLCFSGRSEKQDGSPGLWLAQTFSTSPLKPLNRIQWNLIGSKISTPSTKFVVFWADRKNKMAALASDWPRHFRLLCRNRWTEFSKTWQEASSQCLLPRLCFSGKLGKNNIAALASDWLRYFQLLLWNCERNSTKLDRKQDHNALYQVCVFQVDRKKQNGRPGLWFAETFSTFPLKPLNRIQQNLTGKHDLNILYQAWVFQADQKNKAAASDWLRHFLLLLWNHWTEFNKTSQKASSQRPLPSLCFSGLSKKAIWRPGLWLAETYFDFSSETAERNSAKLDKKQGLNVLFPVCVFRAEKWIKIATLANP